MHSVFGKIEHWISQLLRRREYLLKEEIEMLTAIGKTVQLGNALIVSLEQQVTDLTTANGTLTSTNTSLTSQVTALQAQVADLQSEPVASAEDQAAVTAQQALVDGATPPLTPPAAS